jgi:pilus assembly protein Flp/PilA
MRPLSKFIDRLEADENGAALIEYTVLLGILLVAGIVIIVGVGQWISAEWASLSSNI